MAGLTLWSARIAFVVALVALLCVVASGPGYRLELWDLRTALFTLFRIAAYGGLGAALVGFVIAVLAVIKRTPGALWGILALITGMAAGFFPLSMRSQAERVPAIHDITTDANDPPEFVAIAPLRQDAPNPPEYDPAVYASQRDAYPDIGTIRVREGVEQVVDQARQVAEAMGWELVEVDADAGRIEATDTTPWFGFKDDVVIRVQERGGVTAVDVRSKSRVGRSDLGVNAERIRAFRHQLLNGLTGG